MNKGTLQINDIIAFEKELSELDAAVQAVQDRLKVLKRQGLRPSRPSLGSRGLLLMRRQAVLGALGLKRKVSRAAWSHDRGDAIIFDAWHHIWELDGAGNLCRYPMRTKKHYNLAKSRENIERGHTRWQHHVDLVLAKQRSAIAILPVKADSDDPNVRTKGWLPQCVTGTVVDEGGGEYWFHAKKVTPIIG